MFDNTIAGKTKPRRPECHSFLYHWRYQWPRGEFPHHKSDLAFTGFRTISLITVYVSSIVKVLEAQEAVSESGRPDINLVIGGTTLLTPDDMFELLLGQFSHF